MPMRIAAMLLVLTLTGLVAGDRRVEGHPLDTHAVARAHRLDSIAARTARADVFSDAFQRSALGSNWAVAFGRPGIIGDSDLGLLSGVFALLSWAAAPASADQFSEAQISANPGEADKGVFVRRRASDGARYQFHYDTNGTDADRRPQWQLKYDGVPPPRTRILATNFSAPAPVAGDVLRIEAQGDELRGYVDGRLIVSARDGALPGGGSVGVALLKVGGVSMPTPIFRWWAGGVLPRILALRRSGSVVVHLTRRRPACFSVTVVSNARSRYTFRVANARARVVRNEVREAPGGRPTTVKWCGRRDAKMPTQGKLLSPGRYRSSLQATAVSDGPQVLTPFFTRTWLLRVRR